MIGLGSNRLTVCRRGGMSVTQAGRGGMEWLAGGRMPRWASPYSAQATAALKAQFPTQWPTIRDYGFAHPEIVGYMNAYATEDAKIAYSLVEGIGTRWLVGDGTAYINTEKYITSNNFSEILVRAKFTNVVVGDENDVVTNTAVVAEVYRGYKYTWFVRPWRSWDDVIREAGTAAMTDDTLHILPNGMYIASNPSRFYSQNKEPAATSPFWFFRRPGNLYPYSGGLSIAEVMVDGVYLFSCVPYKKNGAMGMIDLLTGTFYGNANSSGTFTELIDTPAS